MRLSEMTAAATRACRESMAKISEYQMDESDPSIEEKEDASLLTPADVASQEIGRGILQSLGFSYWGEEGPTKGFIGGNRHGGIHDPLDGTGAFAIGLPTPTVIVGIYDRESKKVVACATGEPVSGRIWTASTETPTTICGKQRRVWQGNEKSAVFLDVSHGWKSRGRQILTDAGNARLYEAINRHFKILIPGSNGLMQALVANGRERMAGSITTAVGFPGDVCGALLVKQAGGFLKAYERKDDGSLAETDPLNPLEIDALICTGNEQTLWYLAGAFEAAATVK